MKNYEIWSEGYRVTGNHQTAHKMGEATGKDFREACINYFKKHPSIYPEIKTANFVIPPSNNFDGENLTHWGCKLFDNEEAARKNYG